MLLAFLGEELRKASIFYTEEIESLFETVSEVSLPYFI